MKRLLILTLLTITFIARSETDEALDPTEESLSEQEQLNTAILQLVPKVFFFKNHFSKQHSFVLPSDNAEMVTPIGKPTDVYVVVQGQLMRMDP